LLPVWDRECQSVAASFANSHLGHDGGFPALDFVDDVLPAVTYDIRNLHDAKTGRDNENRQDPCLYIPYSLPAPKTKLDYKDLITV
jgi:hypothetical protein